MPEIPIENPIGPPIISNDALTKYPRKMVYDIICDASSATYAVKENRVDYQDLPTNSSGQGNLYKVSGLRRDAFGTQNTPDGVSQQWVLLDGNPLVTKLPDNHKSDIYIKLVSFNNFGGGKQLLDEVDPWIIPVDKIIPHTLTGSFFDRAIGSTDTYAASVAWRDGRTSTTLSSIVLGDNPIFSGDINNTVRYYNQEEIIDGSALNKTTTLTGTQVIQSGVFDVTWNFPVCPIPSYFQVYVVGRAPSSMLGGRVGETVITKRQTTNGRCRQLALTQDSAFTAKFTSSPPFAAYVIPVYDVTPVPVAYDKGDDIIAPLNGDGNHPRVFTTANAPVLVTGSTDTPGAIVNSLDLDVDTYALITSAGTVAGGRSVTWSSFGSGYVTPGARLQFSLTAFTETHSDPGRAAWTETVHVVVPPDTSCCLLAGTKITMADGSDKVIEEVKVGDSVLCYDVDDQEANVSVVQSIHSPTRTHYFEVHFEDGRCLWITNDHPIYCLSGWRCIDPTRISSMPVGKLEVGDGVANSDGTYTGVTLIRRHEGPIQTWILENVEPFHTFYAENFLVHNNHK